MLQSLGNKAKALGNKVKAALFEDATVDKLKPPTTKKKKNGGWLDNYNDSKASAPEGMVGDGFSNVGRNYSPAWGGQFQDGGDVEKTYSYSLREKLYPGEDEYFKAHPEVGGMAAEDNQVIINPYSPLSNEEKNAIRMNETARLAMRNGYARPTFDLTPEQQESFKNYSTDIQDQKETVIGRILSGDPSAKNVTPEQKKYAEELQKVLKFQMGGSVYPVNYVPDAQNGNKKKKKGVQNLLIDTERSVNKSLGYPMEKGATAAKQLAGDNLWYNPKTKQWEENDPVDNFRHPMAGRYTSEAIQDKLYNIPVLSQIAGMVGSNALGIGHELSTLFNPKDKRGWYDKIRESGEDAFNNAVGATVGSLPISNKEKTNMLVKLSNKNMIPDGVSGKHGDMYIKHAMGGSIPGTPGFTYARTNDPAPSEGPYAKKTMASAKDGKIIKDDMGYWNPDNWGKDVEIDQSDPDSFIDMEGVYEPLLAETDKGEKRIMYPGEKHKFKKGTKKVVESRIAKNGLRQEQKSLQNLDNLLNFTNYNKPQPGGWLSKYE
jgi:hypothetical protein